MLNEKSCATCRFRGNINCDTYLKTHGNIFWINGSVMNGRLYFDTIADRLEECWHPDPLAKLNRWIESRRWYEHYFIKVEDWKAKIRQLREGK